MSCVVKKCKSRMGSGNITFHRFPRDKPLRDLWIAALSREDGWEPQKHHRVCSKHFPETCFKSEDKFKWRRVHPNVVPTLDLRIASDKICSDHLKRIEKLEKRVQTIKEVSKNRLLKVNALRQLTRRLKKRNIDINSRLIEIIANEQIIEEESFKSRWVKNNEVIEGCLSQDKVDNAQDINLEIKKFAMTLHSLSPQSYTLLREELNDVLPHPKTIAKWREGTDCIPGFRKESIDAIKQMATQKNGNTSEQGVEKYFQTHLALECKSPLRSASPDFVYHF